MDVSFNTGNNTRKCLTLHSVQYFAHVDNMDPLL